MIDETFRLCQIGKDTVGRGRNIVLMHQVFREGLAPLDKCRVFGRAEDLQTIGFEKIDNPQRQRLFGTDHRQVD